MLIDCLRRDVLDDYVKQNFDSDLIQQHLTSDNGTEVMVHGLVRRLVHSGWLFNELHTSCWERGLFIEGHVPRIRRRRINLLEVIAVDQYEELTR